jgi:SepF-like predicted cell division protein (DUF552 family)
MMRKGKEMTEANPVQMPQQWSIGNYDGYMVECDEGDFVEVEAVKPLIAEINRLRDVEDVKPLIAEINRLRAEVERLQTLNSQASKVIETATNALMTIAMSPNGHIAASTILRIEEMLRTP